MARSDGTMMTAPKPRLLSQQAASLTFAYHGGKSCPLNSHQQGGLTSCKCWGPENTSVAVEQLWKKHEYRELTFSGYIPGTELRKTHPLVPSSAFMAVWPETFKVELDQTLWNGNIQEIIFVHNLKSLKVPIRLPSDCNRLGIALGKMKRLVRLAITDIPDSPDCVKRLARIGGGILNRAPTLRELDIEMTRFYSLPLIESENEGFIFRKLFPDGLLEKLHELRNSSKIDTRSVVEAPLRLTKLRFKYLSLPLYSFGVIFDARTIKHIHLPCSMVDRKVWEVLETNAQLDTLTEIDYDMLSPEFLHFLSRQSSLKELLFVREHDRGWAMYSILFSAGSGVLSPRIGTRYPSLEEFLSSLQHMKILKHLVLPQDVSTITGLSLSFIAAALTGLEHLELAFDYEDRVSVTGSFPQFESHGMLILALNRGFSTRLLPTSYVVCHP